MGTKQPFSLIVKFFLEVAAYASMASWGWQLTDGGARFVIGPGTAVLAAVIWGTFGVPGDPIRNRKPPVPIPGGARLALEAVFFAFAVWTLVAVGNSTFAIGLAVLAIGYYAASYDRLKWLLQTGAEREE